MKKVVLLFVVALVATQGLSAQTRQIRNRGIKSWFDLQLVQHIGLNKWSDAGYADDALPSASLTELRGVFNFYLAGPKFGGFADLGLGVMPAPDMRSLDLERLPMPHSGTQYYLRETLSESGADAASVHARMTLGLFGNFKMADKLQFMPYLGVGALSMSRRNHEVILKEAGSNMQYHTTYTWAASDDRDRSNMPGYVTGRLNFRYRIGNTHSCLLLGLEYTLFFDSMNFYAKYANTFNGNVRRSMKVTGNRMNMLGISVGLAFR